MTFTLTQPIFGWDTETHRISQEKQAPRVVCLSFDCLQLDGSRYTDLVGNNDIQNLHDHFTEIINDRQSVKVLQNASFDLAVVAANFPDLIPAIFKALAENQISCTLIREKLLVLATTGDLEYAKNPDGTTSKLSYGFGPSKKGGGKGILMRRFGIDISEDKSSPDSFRLLFGELFEGKPTSEYPLEARKYAIDDATYAVDVWVDQEKERQQLIESRGIDAFGENGNVEHFRVYLDFCLRLMTAWGAYADPDAVAVMEEMLTKELAPEKLNLLIEKGILRPAQPPRPHANAKEHTADCKRKNCTCPPRMTKGEDESIDMAALKRHALTLAVSINFNPPLPPDVAERYIAFAVVGSWKEAMTKEDMGILAACALPVPVMEMQYSDKSKKFIKGQLSIDKDWLAKYASLDPTLAQYKHRQDLQKLVGTEVPRMKLRGQPVRVIHAPYDCIKETGRTSSRSDGSDDYASFNAQNVDPRIRNAYIPRPGYLLFSIDFSQMELGTWAQTCYNLFGFSVMRDKMNAGEDVHAFTGAQIAQAHSPEFATMVMQKGLSSRNEFAELFLSLKKSDDPTHNALYKKFRKWAKPVNLGYPGGLGAETFIAFAAGQAYQVVIDLATAKSFKDLWKQTYSEAPLYFKYISEKCVDPFNKGWDEESREEYDLYAYRSPFGMYRAGCNYCACANGLGLQTPSAEGQKTALINIIRACYDWTLGSILGPDKDGPTVRVWGDIHDEFVGEIREDDLVHERMMEMKRIMVESMRRITPDVRADAQPVLMRKWDKFAESVYDSEGRLAVWEPKPKA